MFNDWRLWRKDDLFDVAWKVLEGKSKKSFEDYCRWRGDLV